MKGGSNLLPKLTPELAIAFLGIVCIFFLTAFALYRGVNGVMFGSGMAGIGSIVGWVFKGYQLRRDGKEGPHGSP